MLCKQITVTALSACEIMDIYKDLNLLVMSRNTVYYYSKTIIRQYRYMVQGPILTTGKTKSFPANVHRAGRMSVPSEGFGRKGNDSLATAKNHSQQESVLSNCWSAINTNFCPQHISLTSNKRTKKSQILLWSQRLQSSSSSNPVQSLCIYSIHLFSAEKHADQLYRKRPVKAPTNSFINMTWFRRNTLNFPIYSLTARKSAWMHQW